MGLLLKADERLCLRNQGIYLGSLAVKCKSTYRGNP